MIMFYCPIRRPNEYTDSMRVQFDLHSSWYNLFSAVHQALDFLFIAIKRVLISPTQHVRSREFTDAVGYIDPASVPRHYPISKLKSLSSSFIGFLAPLQSTCHWPCMAYITTRPMEWLPVLYRNCLTSSLLLRTRLHAGSRPAVREPAALPA